MREFRERHLGRSAFPGDTALEVPGVPVSDLVKCLREIQSQYLP